MLRFKFEMGVSIRALIATGRSDQVPLEKI